MEINAQGLEIGYGEFVAVENMDITVKKGEITTIIGPNGSGKSTVLKALTRLLKYRKGVVHLDERDLLTFESKELCLSAIPLRPTSRSRTWWGTGGCLTRNGTAAITMRTKK